jgi:putative aldouronate transport system substrate-binding protein
MMEGKFINGQESLDNFDSFLQNLKKYRVDDLKKIKQEAYDRYAANK